MRAFLLACVATVLVAACAAYVLNSGFLPNAVSTVFSTTGVRI
jgi:hypothetical protein